MREDSIIRFLPASLDMPPYVFIRNGEIVDPHIVLTTDVYRTRQDKPNTHGIKSTWERMTFIGDGVYGSKTAICQLKDSVRKISFVSFRNADTKLPLELKIGFSFVMY